MPEDFSKINDIKNVKSIFIQFMPFFYKKRNFLKVLSICAYRIPKEHRKDIFKKNIKLNDDYYETKFLFKRGLRFFTRGKYSYFINIYSGKINVNSLVTYGPQNLLTLSFKKDDVEFVLPVVYNIIYLTRYLGMSGKVNRINDDLVCYFRQTQKNGTSVTVRKPNVTDRFNIKCKIFFAKILSLFMGKNKRILLYEKECQKYEESSSVLYEKLVDEGYNNAYYLIDRNSKHNQLIQDKYLKNIIYAHSFKHYLNFFRCQKFIGTESVPHSVELRAANSFITKKIINKNYRHVFLQHGVMYMVSLSAKGRSYFIKGKEMPLDAKIVVSSQLEAEHFIDLGGFEQDDLYITGLPFYDRTIKKPDADKIVVMLTWRSWEYNTLASNYKEANYYKMTKNIIDNIPKKYQEKVCVLPHPLILDKFRKTDLGHLIPDMISYDKILEETALLITDYSSIAYSAFYRGANVIFCFQELEECMKEYQGHLMLNEKNIFGDISYNYKDLNKLVENNYLKPQTSTHQKRYKKIVEFDDNKNTERLISMLKKDKFI